MFLQKESIGTSCTGKYTTRKIQTKLQWRIVHILTSDDIA